MYKSILSTIFCLRRQAYNEIYWWVKGLSWALCEIKKFIPKQNYCPKSNITTVALATFSYQLNALHSLWFTLALVFWWEGWLKEVFFFRLLFQIGFIYPLHMTQNARVHEFQSFLQIFLSSPSACRTSGASKNWD